MFQCHQSTQDGVIQLSLEGKLNALTASDMRDLIETLSEQEHTKILLDLALLQTIDSSGVGALVSLIKRTRAVGGIVKIASVKGQPKEIFKLLNLHQAFDIHEEKEQAMEAFLGV